MVVVVVVVGAHAVIKASAPASAKRARLRYRIVFAFRIVFSAALYYHSRKDSRETIRERAQREPRFRKALLREAIELMLSGDEKTGRATLRNYINATPAALARTAILRTASRPSFRVRFGVAPEPASPSRTGPLPV